MPRRTVLAVIAAATLVMTSAPARAHHSFGAEYDSNQPVTLTGVVTKIEWTNPHSFIYLDVADAGGAKVNWKLEGYPPNVLYRTGWKRDVTMKVGDTVTVFAWRARLGGPLVQRPGLCRTARKRPAYEAR